MAALRLLVVDDQALVRSGFSMMLDAEPDLEVVGQAANGIEAVAMARELRPDVVLMDIRMPQLDGIAATQQILSASADRLPRVIILTTFDADAHVYEALRAGASGFLLKDVSPVELVQAVRTVAAGEAMLAPSVVRRLIDSYVTAPLVSDTRPARLEQLTDREADVLTAMTRGLSNGEIAAELYLSPATVKTHVARVLAKLGVRDRVQAVIAAYESGLVRPGSAP